MYLLLKMVVFHGYVSLPERNQPIPKASESTCTTEVLVEDLLGYMCDQVDQLQLYISIY